MKGKNRKTTSGLRATRLVTHNPEVIGSSLAPATIKSPLPTRKAAIFSARLQLFGHPHFLDTGVTQTMTQMGQKRARRRKYRLRTFPLSGKIFCLQCCRQDPFHGFCCLLLGCCCDMGISVQGEPALKYPQYPGHHLGVHAVLEGQRGEGMPEIVESDPRQPRSFQYLVEQTIRRDGTAGG